MLGSIRARKTKLRNLRYVVASMNNSLAQTMFFQQLRRLRGDLNSVRELAALSFKREKRKLAQLEVIQRVLATSFFTHENALRGVFEKILMFVKSHYFPFRPLILTIVQHGSK